MPPPPPPHTHTHTLPLKKKWRRKEMWYQTHFAQLMCILCSVSIIWQVWCWSISNFVMTWIWPSLGVYFSSSLCVICIHRCSYWFCIPPSPPSSHTPFSTFQCPCVSCFNSVDWIVHLCISTVGGFPMGKWLTLFLKKLPIRGRNMQNVTQ